MAWTHYPNVSSQTYTYTANTAQLDIYFDDVAWTPANCTSMVTYTATLSDESALPAYLFFEPANHRFYVYTTNVLTEASLSVKLTATLAGLNATNSTTVLLNVNVLSNYDWCTYYLAWDTLPTFNNQTYQANDTALNFTFDAFTFTPANCSALAIITYTAALADGTALPAYITIDSSTRTFQVVSSDVTLEGDYEIKVVATTSGLNYSNSTYVVWGLRINSHYDWCTYYLVWTSNASIADQTYLANTTK